MRIFLYSIAGIPILFLDGILLYDLPAQVGSFHTKEEGWIILAGSIAYLLVHAFLRKPERMYLWAHELSHLVVAKLFFRKVHSFHITSRDGGKVVIDRTNVVIDLAPYGFPFYSLGTAAAAVVLKNLSPWVPDLYLGSASFLFTMHVLFSAEGFFKGQPDVKRSGRIFSGAVVLLCLILWVPILMAPGAPSGWKGAAAAYRGWLNAAHLTAHKLVLYGLSLF